MSPPRVTVITAAAAAERIGVSTAVLYRGARAGEVPARRVGGRWIFVAEAIDAWLLSGGNGENNHERRGRSAS